VGHVARIGAKRNACRVLIGKAEGMKPFERLRRRWKDNIKMHLKTIGRKDVDWIRLAQDRQKWRAVVNMTTNLVVLSDSRELF
jgi:hypothetical protein